MKRKKEFDCICGHKEKHHNHDPYSAFFGCCERFIVLAGVLSEQCRCDEFRSDNLKYLEEISED